MAPEHQRNDSCHIVNQLEYRADAPFAGKPICDSCNHTCLIHCVMTHSSLHVCCMQCVLNLSSDQVSDLMLLRHVYITRKVLLDAQRAKLITKMQQSSPDAIAEAMKASNVAQQIGDDAGQRRQLFHRVTWAVYCGVSMAYVNLKPDVTSSNLSCDVCW